MLQVPSPLVPPRVWAAVLRTLWNGWLTARRWPSGPMAGATCIFGCAGSEDSIEHYCVCREVAGFARRRLGLSAAASPAASRADFLILDRPPRQRPLAELTLRALRVAAVYKVHNWRRHAARRTTAMAREALHQVVRDLVSGHSRAIGVLDSAGFQTR